MKLARSAAVTAVIVAGGHGRRLGSDLAKPLVPLGRRPLVTYSLETFEQSAAVARVVLVCGEGWLDKAEELGKLWAPSKLFKIIPGGAERVDSVCAGLDNLPESCRIVAIHDAARPFVSQQLIANTLAQLGRYHGVVPGIPLWDTLRLHEQGLSRGVCDRSRYILTQTPQCFRRDVLVEAIHKAEADGFPGTDDAAYVERLPGARIAVVDGEPANFKITSQDDLDRARAMLDKATPSEFRCGEGFDAHCLVFGRPLILGGETIPFDKGLEGHSDADVLCHAIGDALLGAAALGDLGKHFPDSDPTYKGMSSIIILENIRELITGKGFFIANVDATLILQEPKVAPYRGRMIENISEALKIDPERVSIKATTTEGMGPEGRGEGISCRAVIMLRQN